jgi:hypothetical protein
MIWYVDDALAVVRGGVPTAVRAALGLVVPDDVVALGE